jgi:opacity protein-like surface antigen
MSHVRRITAVLIVLSMTVAARADVVMNPEASGAGGGSGGVLWIEDFDTVTIGDDPHEGWCVEDPPQASVTIKDSIATIAEIGDRSYYGVYHYVPFDLVTDGGYPYLQFKLEDAPGNFSIANISSAGMTFVSGVAGPGLYSVDLRHCQSLAERGKPGEYALSMMVFGPRGREEAGDPVRIDWIRTARSSEDTIEVTLEDEQGEQLPGHGYISVGDRLRVSVNTSTQCRSVKFQFIDGKTGEPLVIGGKTTFDAVTDPDNQSIGWSASIDVSAESDRAFKTWTSREGEIYKNESAVHVVAIVEGGAYPRLMGYVPYGWDLTPATGGGGPVGAAGHAVRPIELQAGETMLESDFENGADPWQAIAGDQWTLKRGRFGDMSDSTGPDGLGNWAVAGRNTWRDYKFTAQMSEQLDGVGSAYLAVRFQDPRNYYALHWLAEGKDTLQLIRCKDGDTFVIAKSEGHQLDDMPFTIGISVSGDYLTGYLNDQPVVSGWAGDFDAGRVALGASARKVLVDNASVSLIVSEARRSGFLRSVRLRYDRQPRYFLRDTGEMDLPFVVSNSSDEAFDDLQVRISFGEVWQSGDWLATSGKGALFPAIERTIDRLEPGASIELAFPIDTRLIKAGEYVINTQISQPSQGLSHDKVIHFGIARNWNPHRFNYFTWGMPGDEARVRDYAEHGHTMGIGGGRSTPLDWEYNGMPVPPEAQGASYGSAQADTKFHRYDYALKYGMVGGHNLQTVGGDWMPKDTHGQTRDGVATRHPLPYHPRVHDYSVNFARTVAQELADYPAYQLMDINSETEHHNDPDFSPLGLERARTLFGGEPPEQVDRMYAMSHSEIDGMAINGVIADDHPLLRFYRWFWLEGEGFNTLAQDMAEAVLQVKPEMIVFHDPADRMPFVRDRHQGLHQWDWTYTDPNALTIPYKIEVLRAMSKPGFDKVVNYVQVLWKATIASPNDECPSASIIRLGLLYSTSRSVFAAGHWNTDWMTDPQNLDRWAGVKRLYEEMWRPLGPVITRLEDGPRPVAMLVSHTNALFAAKHRGKWAVETGYAGWHEAFARAGIAVDIIFEETVAEGGLDKYESLFIPFGEVISRSAYDKIVAFANGGGHVVADHNLGYKIPNVTLLENDLDHCIYDTWAWRKVSRGAGVNAQERIERMWRTVGEIESLFADALEPVATPGDPWLVLHTRQFEGIPYIFAINDKRSAGEQVGQYNVMLERGEPLTASMSMPVSGDVAVYDLSAHRRIDVDRSGDRIRWTSDYNPASGRLFAVLPQAIEQLKITMPGTAYRGEAFTIDLFVRDAADKPVRGLVPVELIIRDSRGVLSEYSDIFAAVNGRFSHSGFIASNDPAGRWEVTVRDLASGRELTGWLNVDSR